MREIFFQQNFSHACHTRFAVISLLSPRAVSSRTTISRSRLLVKCVKFWRTHFTSLQNLIKYKYLLYISFLFCLVSTVPFYSRKKKGKRKSRERKTKKGPDVSTSLFAFSLLLSSQLMCVSFFFVVVVFSFLVLFRFCLVVFLSFVTFYLYLICCLLK